MAAGSNDMMVPFKADTGGNGNIRPLHIYKMLFPKIASEHLVANKNKNILIKRYNKTKLIQYVTRVQYSH